MLLVAITSTATYLVTARHSSTDSATSLANASSARLDSNRSSTDRTEPRPAPIVAVVPDSGQRAETPGGATTPGGTQIVTVKNTSKKPSAEQVYSSEIARLRTLVNQRRSQLDPVTISVIERNLKVIDDAIAQCRLALAKDPASRFLMESLNSALETKVELLRTATMLPARS
jgi:hypothetical protein